jgi:hypothetical protein
MLLGSLFLHLVRSLMICLLIHLSNTKAADDRKRNQPNQRNTCDKPDCFEFACRQAWLKPRGQIIRHDALIIR